MNPRIGQLYPYPFERLRALLDGAAPPPSLRHIPLSIGEPKHAPPPFIAAALTGALDTLGSYPAALGLPELRSAAARWLERRYTLPAGSVDAERMVLPVNGTREGLFAFVQAVVGGSRDRPAVLMPNPFYQIYEGAALLAGAEPVYLGCTRANGWLPDLDAVSPGDWARCQVLFLCSPGNPTGAVMPEDYLRRAIELADRHDFVIASDECYSEIYDDERRPPAGILAAARAAGHGSYERCVAFHSLSKRSSVPGLRSGFVAGDARVLADFRLYRTYHGCAMPLYAQRASVPAWDDEAHVIENRRLYRSKFDAVLPILREVMEVERPAGAFYLWPEVGDDEAWTRGLHAGHNVTVLPGSYLSRPGPGGNPGRGRVRISLVAPADECVEAARRIVAYVRNGR
ncbi:MAG: succinyldiaminopimelate transaminase [Steroidobacteraceae bacterium]